MPKNLDLEKHTLNLRRGDVAFLASVCHPRGLNVSHVIRELVSKRVDELRARETPMPKDILSE